MSCLNIFIDESGDFGFREGHAEYYVISFVLHDSKNSIDNQLEKFNNKLIDLGHSGMVHLGDLAHGTGSYKNVKIEDRKKVLWSTIYFATRCDIKIHSIVIDRKFINSKSQLNKALLQELQGMISVNESFFKSYKKIKVYYDYGQEQIGTIIDASFMNYNYTIVSNFNKTEKRLFQVADMLTYIDKGIYKYHKKVPFSNSETIFFTKPGLNIGKSVSNIKKSLKNKRL